MDNLTYIAFISLTISLGLMLPLMEKKVRRLVIFMIVGIFACLFVSELNNILLEQFNNDNSNYGRNSQDAADHLFRTGNI